MGDLNDDGCDEFAVSAAIHDRGANDQGQIRVVYGFNPDGTTCAFDRPRHISLAPGLVASRAGTGLAGGVDADGDDIPDLAVGAQSYRVAGVTQGAAFFLPGSYLGALPSEPLCHEGEISDIQGAYTCPVCTFADAQSGSCNPRASEVLHGFTPTGRTTPILVTGQTLVADFGASVALTPATEKHPGYLAVGASRANISGTLDSGGAYVFAIEPHDGGGGIVSQMAAIMTGFGVSNTRLGVSTDAVVVGDDVRWLVGAERGPGVSSGVDLGGAYLMTITP